MEQTKYEENPAKKNLEKKSLERQWNFAGQMRKWGKWKFIHFAIATCCREREKEKERGCKNFDIFQSNQERKREQIG